MAANDPAPSHSFANITFARMFCAVHGEPFRSQWPKGAALFQLKGIAIVLESAEAELAGLGMTDESSKAEREHCVELLFDRKPVCCRLPKVRLLALYKETDIGVKSRCVHCRKKQLGTSMLSRRQDETITIPHICFECVVFYAYENVQ